MENDDDDKKDKTSSKPVVATHVEPVMAGSLQRQTISKPVVATHVEPVMAGSLQRLWPKQKLSQATKATFFQPHSLNHSASLCLLANLPLCW